MFCRTFTILDYSVSFKDDSMASLVLAEAFKRWKKHGGDEIKLGAWRDKGAADVRQEYEILKKAAAGLKRVSSEPVRVRYLSLSALAHLLEMQRSNEQSA